MKKLIFILPLVSLLLLVSSCKKEKAETVDQANEVVLITNPQSVSDFCEMTRQLKAQLIEDLKSGASQEPLVIDFLYSYAINQIQLGSFLEETAGGNTDALCSDVFRVSEDAGNGLLRNNTTFLKEGVTELLDPTSSAFMEIYCLDYIDNPAEQDGSIVADENELVRRAIAWGEVLGRPIGDEYQVIAEPQYDSLLKLLFKGTDAQPRFDAQGAFCPKTYAALKEAATQQPDTKAAKEFLSFLELLDKNKLKNTAKVKAFLKERF